MDAADPLLTVALEWFTSLIFSFRTRLTEQSQYFSSKYHLELVFFPLMLALRMGEKRCSNCLFIIGRISDGCN
jgi:hypothetical protein